MKSREEFLAIYAKHLPKKWVRFAFKYFSKQTEKKDMKLSNTIVFLLAAGFLVGMIGTIAQWPRAVIMWATLGYGFACYISSIHFRRRTS